MAVPLLIHILCSTIATFLSCFFLLLLLLLSFFVLFFFFFLLLLLLLLLLVLVLLLLLLLLFVLVSLLLLLLARGPVSSRQVLRGFAQRSPVGPDSATAIYGYLEREGGLGFSASGAVRVCISNIL